MIHALRSDALDRDWPALFGGMLRGTLDHFAIRDMTGRYVYINAACAEWFGIPIDEIIGRTCRDLFSPDVAARVAADDQVLLAGGPVREIEESLVIGGVERTWLTTKNLIRDEDGRLLGFAGISREITRRVTAERALAKADEALKQNLDLLNAVLDRTIDHIGVRDVEGRFLLVNRACAEWYGWSAEHMLGRTCDELFPEAEAQFVRERDRQILALGARMSYEETHVLHGVPHIWLTTRDTIRDEAGAVIAHFAISREITELREAEAQSQEAKRMETVGRLAGGIAHDFNNLLMVISGNVELLLADLGDHPGRQAATEIASAAERAATVTRQLLAFSRQQTLVPEVLDIDAVLAAIEPAIHGLVDETITISRSSEPGVRRVHVDRAQLEQVLVNLVMNARDAMPDGGTLTIAVGNRDIRDSGAGRGLPGGRYVEIAVSDTGAGMDASVTERMFEPFYSTKGPGRGAGLGLSMVEGVVRQSGGDIAVESAIGAGTTVRILLPHFAGPGGVPPSEPAKPHVTRNPALILLVEDEPAVREIARRMLIGAGYVVLTASDPAAALPIIDSRGRDVDLLLTDVLMPGGTGREVALALRAVNPRAATLYMSGYTDDAIGDRGILDPGVALLEKPFTRPTLLAAVAEQLANMVQSN